MKITHRLLILSNLIGISLLLMIPIFNLWYASLILDKSIYKECIRWNTEPSYFKTKENKE